ncbi:hypothetical protein ACFSGX_02945 [Sphingomonas arantia]|uniref:TonB C-terminal domain-containing protein n=1 Tax=Sphingomonas arantia TaxID=1460676 RepID=A0ABW4TSS5_9SPHN
MLILLLLALAQPAASPVAPTDQTITITGVSLKVTGDALESCLARACPPAEDIATSMTHAENQLIAGDLQGARTTLLKSTGRNKPHAKKLPVPVSNLLFFNAEVASLSGLTDSGRIGTIDSLSALKAGLPKDGPQVATQRLLVADVFRREGRYPTAVKMYDAIADQAARSGWPSLQAAAMFRSLAFYATAASISPAYRGEARRRYAALRRLTTPASQTVRDASALLEAKLLIMSDTKANIDDVLQQVKTKRTTTPMLVMMPPVDLGTTLTRTGGTSSITRNQWVDFRFRITGDGTVEDIEQLTRAPNAQGEWIERAQRALADRRYLPLALPPGSTGLWRRERFMVVADQVASDRSRIRTHVGKPRLHILDLTPDADAELGAASNLSPRTQ